MVHKQIIQSSLLSFFAVIIIFGVHYIFPSMINYNTSNASFFEFSARVDNVFLEDVYRYHMALPAFARRPLTSKLINSSHNFFNLNFANSFILVNFGLFFLCGVILYYLARLWKSEHKHAMLSVFLFYASFTVFLAFFSSIFTYDEPLQYLLIFLSLIFATKKRWLLFSLCFFLAMWARETSLFLFFGFLPLFFLKKISIKKLFQHQNYERQIVFAVGSVLLYLLTMGIFLKTGNWTEATTEYFLNTRFGHWNENFLNQQFSIESVVSIILAVGWQFFVMLVVWKKQFLKKRERSIILAVLIVFLIGTPIAFVTSKVREARILALPMVFLWPVLGKYTIMFIQDFLDSIKKYVSRLSGLKFIFSSSIYLFGMYLAYYFSFVIYTPTASGGFDWGYQLFLLFTLLLIWSYYYFKDKRKLFAGL